MSVQIRGRQIMDSTVTAAKLVLSDAFDFTSGTVSVAAPSSANHAANKSYVDSAIQGVHWKDACRVKGGTNISVSSAPAAIDGVTMAANDRVLLTGQSTATENGIYVYNGSGSAMTRAADANPVSEMVGAAIFIKAGTSGDEGFVQTADAPVDFADLVWVQFSGAGNITAGDALGKVGNTLNVLVDNSSIEVASDALRIKSSGVTNAMLANSSMSIAGQSISLGGSIAANTILGQSSTSSLPEGSNQYFTTARAQASISVTDSSEFDLSYSEGAISGALKNGSVANARLANSAITIAGASTSLGGSITAAAILGASDTDALSEGSTNQYFSTARAQASISVTDSSEFDLSYSGGAISGALKNGSVANARLANSSVSFGGISLSLGGSDATPAFDLSDATAYPTSSLVGTITNAQLAGSIANAKLANSSVSFGGVSLALGASDATPAFNLSDATAYPTSSLTGTITNAQLAGSIAAGKLLLDSGVLEAAGNNLSIKAGSIDSVLMLDNTITTGKLGYQGYYESFSANGSTAGFDLARGIKANLGQSFVVTVNGLVMDYKTSPDAKDNFKIDNTGAGSVGKITFGANLDNGDKVAIRYVA